MDNFRNPEAEMILIGSIMKQNNIMAEADAMLRPADFSVKANEVIFTEMLAMFKEGIGIDYITLAGHMKPETLQAIGGLSYLVRTSESPATLLNYREHIKDIKTRSNSRTLAATLTESMEMVKADDPEEVVQYLQSRIMETHRQAHTGLATTDKIALEILEGKAEPAIMTGFTTMDRVMRGLKRGRVLTIAGRPGTGKTAFSLRILDQLPEPERAIYFSLEMSRREITERIMAAQTQIKLDKIINRTFSESEKSKIRDSKVMKRSNLIIDDSPGMNINRIRAKARIEKIKHGLSVIFIDHIGLLNPSTAGMKSYERMTEISKGMKDLAKELDVTVIALSQLNRAPETRKDGSPILSDLRDSGSVEQDSDQVILLYNPDYQEKSDKGVARPTGPERLIAKIAKNRSGGIGKIALDYYKDTQLIEETSR